MAIQGTQTVNITTDLQRYKVLAAGIFSMIVTLGIARFSYTPLLPLMQSQTVLSESGGGWLAAANYAGYMCGAILVAFINNLTLKGILYRVYLILAVLTTLAMAWTENVMIWSILRFFSGLSSSGGMLIASGIILNWLMKNGHRGELGIHFAGMGLGIILASALVELMLHYLFTWQEQWTWFAVVALILSIPAWLWIPNTKEAKNAINPRQVKDNPPSRTFLWIMLAAYFCAGYGYVISATFMVDIIESQASLKGQGPMVFMLVGLAALPAAIIWDRIAHRWGYLNAIFLAYAIQVVGITLPLFNHSLTGAIISALLYGGTFIGCVSLVLTMAGRFYPGKPAKLMGKLTLTYGFAQIIAPALTGMIAQNTGSYDQGLYIAGGVLSFGAFLILLLIRMERREAKLKEIIES